MLVSFKQCYKSVLTREVTGVPEKHPQSQVEIDWNSAHIQHLAYKWETWWMTITPAWLSKEYSTGDFPDGQPSSLTGLNFGEQAGTGVSLWCKPYLFHWLKERRLHFYRLSELYQAYGRNEKEPRVSSNEESSKTTSRYGKSGDIYSLVSNISASSSSGVFFFLFLFVSFFLYLPKIQKMFVPGTGREGRCYCRAARPYVAFTWKHPFSVHRKTLVDICNLTDHSHIFLGDFSPISRYWRSNYWGCEGNTDIFAIWATRLSHKVSEKNRIMNHIAQERTDLWLSFEYLHFYLRFTPPSRKSEPLIQDNKLKHSWGKHCSLAFIWMVTIKDFFFLI